MPDLVQVPADVRIHAPGGSIEILKSGIALDAGMPVYRASDERYFPTQSDTQEHAAAKYIVLVGCTAADKYFAAVKVGTIGVGAVLAEGETYIVSDTPGAIKPIGDAGTGEWVTILGFGKAADELAINFSYSPIAKP